MSVRKFGNVARFDHEVPVLFMAKYARFAISLFAKPHDRAQRLVSGEAPPRIERKNLIRIGAPLRAVGMLAWKRYPPDGLKRRHGLGPLDRGILHRHALQVGAELGAELIFRGIVAEERDDEIEQGAVIGMHGHAREFA